jgi:hypothetical protein
MAQTDGLLHLLLREAAFVATRAKRQLRVSGFLL